MIRLHVAQYYQTWKIEEEVTADGKYITLPETFGSFEKAWAFAVNYAAEQARKWHEEMHLTIIRNNRNPTGLPSKGA